MGLYTQIVSLYAGEKSRRIPLIGPCQYGCRVLYGVSLMGGGGMIEMQNIYPSNMFQFCLNYLVTQKLPQIDTVHHATFPIKIRKIIVQICGNFWVTQKVIPGTVSSLQIIPVIRYLFFWFYLITIDFPGIICRP